MISNDIFESCKRTGGDIAGVFEVDGDTGYFYLYKLQENGDDQVIAAIPVLVGLPDFAQSDVEVRWDSSETKVGLFIKHVLWAVHDAKTSQRYGQHYRSGEAPNLPAAATEGFDAI